jgi:cytochrome oxidase Cu insertion factor (SCO1/SenC/PrrC family)
VAAALLWSLAAPAAADFEVQTYAPRKEAPGFSLPALDGRVTSLSDLRGHVALLFFWATW